MHATLEPSWYALKDEELLALRICDLGVRIEQSELEAANRQLYNELAAVSLVAPGLLPWGTSGSLPRECGHAIPFYLAHPRLKTLELHQMLKSREDCGMAQMVLRHECGHTITTLISFPPRDCRPFSAARTSMRRKRTGRGPTKQSFVRHLPNWYAQAPSDEDLPRHSPFGWQCR